MEDLYSPEFGRILTSCHEDTSFLVACQAGEGVVPMPQLHSASFIKRPLPNDPPWPNSAGNQKKWSEPIFLYVARENEFARMCTRFV